MVKSKYSFCLVKCLTVTRQLMFCTQYKYCTCSSIRILFYCIVSIIYNTQLLFSIYILITKYMC